MNQIHKRGEAPCPETAWDGQEPLTEAEAAFVDACPLIGAAYAALQRKDVPSLEETLARLVGLGFLDLAQTVATAEGERALGVDERRRLLQAWHDLFPPERSKRVNAALTELRAAEDELYAYARKVVRESGVVQKHHALAGVVLRLVADRLEPTAENVEKTLDDLKARFNLPEGSEESVVRKFFLPDTAGLPGLVPERAPDLKRRARAWCPKAGRKVTIRVECRGQGLRSEWFHPILALGLGRSAELVAKVGRLLSAELQRSAGFKNLRAKADRVRAAEKTLKAAYKVDDVSMRQQQVEPTGSRQGERVCPLSVRDVHVTEEQRAFSSLQGAEEAFSADNPDHVRVFQWVARRVGLAEAVADELLGRADLFRWSVRATLREVERAGRAA